MDEELKAYLERMEARLVERVETEARQTRVVVEGMHDKICLLAEGIIGTGERIDALREETTARLSEIKGSVDMVHRVLVPRVESIENRVKALEGHVERRNRDVLEVLRERILASQP